MAFDELDMCSIPRKPPVAVGVYGGPGIMAADGLELKNPWGGLLCLCHRSDARATEEVAGHWSLVSSRPLRWANLPDPCQKKGGMETQGLKLSWAEFHVFSTSEIINYFTYCTSKYRVVFSCACA